MCRFRFARPKSPVLSGKRDFEFPILELLRQFQFIFADKMTQNNNLTLETALANVFNWNADSIGLSSIPNGGIVLLPYELNDQDENPNDKQSACISYVKSISKPNKIFFVTTSKWISSIIPLIHHYRQIDSIFILFTGEEHCEYDQKYSKIIGCFSSEKQLIDSIHEQIILEEQQRLAFSFYNQHQKSTRDLSKESASFLWLLLFRDIIVKMKLENNREQAKEELIEKLKRLYRNNRTQLKLIEHFDKTYETNDNEPLRWYTGKPFLHKQINRALRTEDIQMLHTFRYIISDISHCLKQEFENIKEWVDQITLYRGLRVSYDELEQLKKNVGKMISTNGFLSTSRSRTVALAFASQSTEDKQSVLFEIECNLNELEDDSVIFADISQFSEIKDEDEILFDIGATFIMENISYDQKLNIWLVKLKVTDEAAKIAQFYLERNKQFLENSSVILTFGILLHMMGQYNQAFDYFQTLLDNSTEDKGFIQFFLGIAQFELGRYNEAFECLEQARTMFESRTPPYFASEIYAHIGYILSRMECHDKALKVHLQCLTIAQNRVKPDPYYIATCFGRVGNVYFDKCQYDSAMDYYMKSNHLLSTCCSSDHIAFGQNLGNIGSVHYLKGDIDQALIYYERGLKILEKHLIYTHKEIVSILNNLGNIRRDQGDYAEALKYFQKCLAIEMEIFPDGHLDIALTFNQIGQLLCLQENYDPCLENYFKALNIQIELGYDTHMDYAITLYNIGYVYGSIGEDLDTASDYARQAFHIIEHNQMITTRAGGKSLLLIGNILRLQANYNDALQFVVKALQVLKDVYGLEEHPDVALCLTELGEIYKNTNMLNLALQSHKEALIIREHLIPTNASADKSFISSRYKDIVYSLSNITHIYFQMNEIELASQFWWKSLTIRQIYSQSNDYEKLIMEMKLLAQTWSGLEKYEEALTCYLQIATLITTDNERALNLSNIGQCYRGKKNYLLALDYYNQALAIVSTMDISNPNKNIASVTIKQDINEMICECVIKVFIGYSHWFYNISS